MTNTRKLHNRLLLRAVVICDDFVFGTKANAMLERVGRYGAVNIRWAVQCWPMNALNDMKLAELLLAEALDAHLIVFPARRAQALPDWIYKWLGEWARRRVVKDAALAVMRDESLGELAVEVFAELCCFVREHGLNLITHEGPATRKRAEACTRFPEQTKM